jgi:CheY-like chemotaxis protein
MLELHPEAVIFEDILKRVLNIVNYQVVKKQQKLEVFIDENIPRTFVCDGQRLVQVITNLLSNAVKFTPNNGHISLDIKLLEASEIFCVIQFTVTDSGIGISKDQISKLFDAFEQVKTSIVDHCSGTGLGLPISKRIVNLMGGDIRVTSTIGEGSVFTFSIKAKKTDKRVEEHLFNKKRGTDGKADVTDFFYGYRALLVEDVDINREIVMAVLEPTLLEIDIAKNGDEAVRMYKENPERYNIIFMDLQMTVMDGYEATRSIRALETPSAAEIPIIAMTANVFKDDIDNCLDTCMNGHIGNPLDFNDVLRVLRHYLFLQVPVIEKDRRVKNIGMRKDLDRRKAERVES